MKARGAAARRPLWKPPPNLTVPGEAAGDCHIMSELTAHVGSQVLHGKGWGPDGPPVRFGRKASPEPTCVHVPRGQGLSPVAAANQEVGVPTSWGPWAGEDEDSGISRQPCALGKPGATGTQDALGWIMALQIHVHFEL